MTPDHNLFPTITPVEQREYIVAARLRRKLKMKDSGKALDEAIRNRKDFQDNIAFWTKHARRKGFPNAESAYRNTAAFPIFQKLCAEAELILKNYAPL